MPSATSGTLFKVAIATGAASLLIAVANTVLALANDFRPLGVILTLAAAQCLLGAASAVSAIVQFARTRGLAGRGWAIAVAVVAVLLGLGGVAGGFFALVASALGAAWGRPLRVRGRILHPSLQAGSDWTRGARPDVSNLDAPTRTALEALWLHDAQKEHASVPAFARISWLLAAVGAPAELLEGAHRAAMEEIDHARRCFALAAGYGGRSHSVEAMPELLVGGLDMPGDPLVYLAVESLKDGCLLEDFNADVAGACEAACEDPATRDVLGRIAREERSHADFSWQLLAWLLERGGDAVKRPVERAVAELDDVPRPTPADAHKQALVDLANPRALRAHGRLEDGVWRSLWRTRLDQTKRRARALLSDPAARAHLAVAA